MNFFTNLTATDVHITVAEKEGQLIDMTMSEFADYREKKGVNDSNYNEPECCTLENVFYMVLTSSCSGIAIHMRACVDQVDPIGAILITSSLRSKAGVASWYQYKTCTGCLLSVLIQEKYRAGYFTLRWRGNRKCSAKLSYKGEEVDLCLCPTHTHFSQEGKTRILALDPVTIEFRDLTVKL